MTNSINKLKVEFVKDFIHNKSLLGIGDVHATGESVWNFIEKAISQTRLEERKKIVKRMKKWMNEAGYMNKEDFNLLIDDLSHKGGEK